MKVIISGGGTGGHIFPAISIANALKNKYKDVEILFVGAKGKMEMQKVPQAGYEIVGLPVAGFQRKKLWKNVSFPFKLLASMLKARKVIKNFSPDVVIGVGGYASGPILRSAVSQKIPTLIQEQNSYPGVTNKILSDGVNAICVAYENMERWFPVNKIVFTGNPIRQNISSLEENMTEIKNKAISTFNLKTNKPIVLVVGGSLGALTINESIAKNIEYFIKNDIQLIWQTGKWFYDKAKEIVSQLDSTNIKVYDFITEMDQAYSLADVVISRAGAIAISELCVIGKPCILVPSPNVSEDHQTKNASALVSKSAAIMVKDIEAREKLVKTLEQLINNPSLQEEMSENILKLGIRDADKRIVEQIEKILNK